MRFSSLEEQVRLLLLYRRKWSKPTFRPETPSSSPSAPRFSRLKEGQSRMRLFRLKKAAKPTRSWDSPTAGTALRERDSRTRERMEFTLSKTFTPRPSELSL